MLTAVVISLAGCQSGLDSNAGSQSFFGGKTINFAEANPPSQSIGRSDSIDDRLAQIAGETPRTYQNEVVIEGLEDGPIVRAQSQDNNSFSGGFGFPQGSSSVFGGQASGSQNSAPKVNQANSIGSTEANSFAGGSSGVQTANYQPAVTPMTQDEDIRRDDAVKPAQFPEFDRPGLPFTAGNGLPSPNIGAPNEMNPLVQPFERGGNASFPNFPANYADLDIYVSETQTGRFNFGSAYNSDNGIVGQFTIDEQNFDITRWPRSLSEIIDGTAWRGAGQRFRLELVPGANLERYSVNFTEPFLLGTDYSLSVSAYLFDRNYFDWDEERLGGRVSFGRRLTPDISINMGVRLESVSIDNARTNASAQLNDTIGTSNLFLFNAGLVRDTRDSTVNATEGNYLSINLAQAFGDYNYTRGDLDFRTYKLLYERPDGSGRHTISYGTKLGLSGSSTPIFENYYAGGFSTLRGFDFRGAAPNEAGVRVGGEFQWLNTVEYMFPLTADDALKGVVFCDFGTVEESIELNSENFRVAPGFGFRVAMPGAAGGAPLAFDFAFPIATADGDEERVFSFYLGVLR